MAFFLIQSIVFLSAFLLFQVELISAKIFLSNFGGSYLVWGASVVFFQAILLLGYWAAHVFVTRLGICRYRKWHLLLSLVPFLFFPGRFIPLSFSLLHWPMVVEVLFWLLITIGPGFFFLSCNSLIWQSWLSRSSLKQQDNPYRLFAVSNFGSFLALFSYPFIFEYFFNLDTQQQMWRVGYVILCLMQVMAYKMVPVSAVSSSGEKDVKTETSMTMKWIWLFYGAAAVVMYLSVNNLLTSEIAPVPLLWVIPLALYLLSFVLVFKQRSWCPRWISRSYFLVLSLGIFIYFLFVRQVFADIVVLLLMILYLFFFCLFCQDRLHALKPKDKERLTLFYLFMSLGGFLGGAWATWIVPLISVTFVEFFYGLLFLAVAVSLEKRRGFFHWKILILSGAMIGIFWVAPFLLNHYQLGALLAFLLSLVLLVFITEKWKLSLVPVLVAIILLINFLESAWMEQKYVRIVRNYYGITKIFDRKDIRLMLHGTTIHGAQFMDEKRRFIPLVYYNPKSPASKQFIANPQYQRIAVIGLGPGSLAMFGRPEQRIDFFEIDKDVLDMAQEHFVFLKSSQADLQVMLGDARKSLTEIEAKYDLMIIDAFSGDSIPFHFLTYEALELYRKRLKPNGVVIFHLSNIFLDLVMPVTKTATSLDALVLYQFDNDYISRVIRSHWVAVTWDQNVFNNMKDELGWKKIDPKSYSDLRTWTDGYSSILPYFKSAEIFERMRKIKY